MDKTVFLIIEGLTNLWRHKGTAFISIITVCLSLFFLGMLFIINENSDKLPQLFRSKYKVEVFFNEEVTNEGAEHIISQISAQSIVKKATLVKKEDAVHIYEDEFGENVMDMLGYNPFPASCIIKLQENNFSTSKAELLLKKIKNLKGVSSIYYQGHLISRVESLHNYFLGFMKILVAIVLLISIIFITNTVKLTIYARSELIRNLKLIGATNLFVKIPFIFEGMLQSIIGAFLSYGLLILMVNEINRMLNEWVSIQLFMGELLPVWLAIVSITIGFIGSIKAVSKFL
jgi:cell division transport system permease protein|tara:strand:- start:119 stop:982 length:864 start_codon:yes stop_codon:yes gene_type:complete